MCRDDGIGRRSGLKIRRPLRSWGFDPPSRHHHYPILILIFSECRPHLFSEYCELGELTIGQMEGTANLNRLVFFRKICDAVAVAHRKGIVHRDIKPENMLMKPGRHGACSSRFRNLLPH
jgi:serine/threonine protein kinase